MTAEKLPKDYLDQYKDPDIFNKEYSKYVSHINADVDESGDQMSAKEEMQRLDFYSRNMNERDEDLDDLQEGFDQIQTRDVDKSLGSQPSI